LYSTEQLQVLSCLWQNVTALNVHAPSEDKSDYSTNSFLWGITAGFRPCNANGVSNSDGCNQTHASYFLSFLLLSEQFKKTCFKTTNYWPYIKNVINKLHLIVMLQHAIPRTYPTDSSNVSGVADVAAVINFRMWYKFSNTKSNTITRFTYVPTPTCN
jgi:hypothetical protein